MLNGASGGAAMSTLGLIASLERLGVQSCAVCHDAGSESERRRLSDAVRGEVVFTPLYWWNQKIRHSRLLRPLAELRQRVRTGWVRGSTSQVRRAVQQWGAELIHTNTILTPEGGLAAAELGLPHVWHVRELIGPGKPFRFAHEGLAFGDHVKPLASKILANSNVTASLIRAWLPPGMLEVVPNGIDVEAFTSISRPEPARLVVAMVAGLAARWKKHDVFVKAALAVDPSLPVEFRIYGHDPSEGGTKPANAYIDNLHHMIAQAGAKSRFGWPGYVADVRAMMSEIDILVHSADHESFGRVIVEAMAASLPVVGVDAGGVAEVAVSGQTALLVPPDDPPAMAAAIEQLARDPARRAELGRKGRQRALAMFSLDASARGVLAVYEAAMALPLVSAGARHRRHA